MKEPSKLLASVIMDLKIREERGLARYSGGTGDTIPAAKECALIAVDEILKTEPRYPSNVDWDDVGGTHQYYYEAQREEADKYWLEVKQEIQKL
jgi:hypothetical protein